MFHRKTLSGIWATDTIDGHSRSLDGNQYAQVFTNRGYFAKLYPMASKSSAGDALKIFCREFGVPEKLISDGSKEQTVKNTKFVKTVRDNDITHQIIEPDMHNHNPAEGIIREIRRKWYRMMICKASPKRAMGLWNALDDRNHVVETFNSCYH